MRTVRASIALLACLVGLSSLGCNRKPTPRLKVAATLFPLYDLTRRVAGDDADVVLLVPPGVAEVDLHAADSQLPPLAGVGLAVRVGLGLDDWLEEDLAKAAPKARSLSVGDRVPTLTYRDNAQAAAFKHLGLPDVDPHLLGKVDPHVWMDPQRAELMVKAIAEEMARADVAHATRYRERAASVVGDLEALDHEIEGRVAGWASRGFVAFRPSMNYFASRYHLEVLGCLEAYPGAIPPLRYDQQMVRLVRLRGIAGVFKEPQFPSRPASIVAEATKVPIGVLDVLGGAPPVDSYEKLIRFDADALERVMKAPPLPPSMPEGGLPIEGDAAEL